MAEWQIAPPEYKINSFDAPKFQYRKYVENLVHSIPIKSLRRKTFVTISTNVHSAEITSNDPSLHPADRDIYKPLEISLTKWSVADYSCRSKEKREFKSETWILNPGPADSGCVCYAKDHASQHKIDFEKFSPKDPYVEKDLKGIVKEINRLLEGGRIVFSNTINHCRQDLGCLKWLNRETGYNMKPIEVYSVEDLYVVLLRRLCPEGYPKEFICKGVARFSYDLKFNEYDESDQCRYHRERRIEDDEAQCKYCARAIAERWGHAILDDINNLLKIEGQDDGDLTNSMATLNLGPAGDKH